MTDTQTTLLIMIGEKVRRYRKKAKNTQSGLAESVGMSRVSIVNLEAGRQNVPIETLYQIACELNVEIRDIIPTLEELLAEVMR